MLEVVIKEGGKSSFKQILRDICNYRDLLLILAWRDYKVRYAQTALGFVWAFIQPISTLVIFTFVFNKVAKIDTGNVPYVIYAQAGMVAWTYFSFLLNQAGVSIIGAQNMISKIYFPRIIIPLSKAVVGLIDLCINFLLLMVLMLYYQFSVSFTLFLLPLFITATIVAGLGTGIWVSALSIRYRDFKHILPFIAQLGLFISPIAYPSSQVPEKFLFFYYLNPMAGIIEGFRWSIVGGDVPHEYMYLSLFLVIAIFITSIYYFRKVETVMADIV